MPCNSDYMDPSTYEEEAAKTTELLCYVKMSLKIPVSQSEKKYSSPLQYPSKTWGNQATSELCNILASLDRSKLDAIVYNARIKESRELANWWEEHQEADAKKLLKLLNKTRNREDQQEILNRLTPYEKLLLKEKIPQDAWNSDGI